jgi:hypothetical protein
MALSNVRQILPADGWTASFQTNQLPAEFQHEIMRLSEFTIAF